MKTQLKLEQFAQLMLCFLGLYILPLHLNWWMYLLLFFAPDISMLGYLFNPRIGAWCYNIVHHKLFSITMIFLGVFLNNEILILIGIIFYAHSSFDRMLGYGLKYEDSFNHTHLGMIGKK